MAIQKLKIWSVSRPTYRRSVRPLPAPAGSRHQHAISSRDVSGVRRLCRVRARHDLRTCQRRALRGQDEGQETGQCPNQAVGRRAHTRAPGRRHGHSKDRRTVGVGHLRGAAVGGESELRHEQGDRLPIYGPGRQTHRTAEGPPLERSRSYRSPHQVRDTQEWQDHAKANRRKRWAAEAFCLPRRPMTDPAVAVIVRSCGLLPPLRAERASLRGRSPTTWKIRYAVNRRPSSTRPKKVRISTGVHSGS
jgi:hypothetical protein